MVVHFIWSIHFNGTNFINAALIFCLTRGLACSWRNGDTQCCQLSNFADPFSDFFPFKKAPKPYLVSETCRYCHVSARSWFPSARTHLHLSLSFSLSLSLSLSLCASALFSERRRVAALSVKHRYYVVYYVILHASIAEITSQLVFMCI